MTVAVHGPAPERAGPPPAVCAFDVATRAANLDEQARTVLALPGLMAEQRELSRLDRWRLSRLAERLAAAGGGDVEAGALEQMLAAHRRLALRSSALSDAEQAVLEGVHGAWLPTYAKALAGAGAPEGETADFEGDAEQPWVAAACAPFAALLRRELGAAARAANAAAGRELIGPAIVEAFARRPQERFALPVTWAVEADQRVHGEHWDRAFATTRAHHELLVRFPVLGRWLAHATASCATTARADRPPRRRRRRDRPRAVFGAGSRRSPRCASACPTTTRARAASPSSACAWRRRRHRGRCTSRAASESERALQELLDRLRDDGVARLPAPRRCCRDGYGYEALIPAGPQPRGARRRSSGSTPSSAATSASSTSSAAATCTSRTSWSPTATRTSATARPSSASLPRGQAARVGHPARLGLQDRPARMAARPDVRADMRISGYSGRRGVRDADAVPRSTSTGPASRRP